jgi:antitoxin PrlF
MNRITSKITDKGQITLPKPVRESLQVGSGDAVVFEVRKGEALIRKLPTLDPAWTQAVQTTLSEWEDSLDDEL